MLALDQEPKTVISYVLPNCFDHIPFFVGERFKGLLGHGFSQCFGRAPSILTAPAWPAMGSASLQSRHDGESDFICGMTSIECSSISSNQRKRDSIRLRRRPYCALVQYDYP